VLPYLRDRDRIERLIVLRKDAPVEEWTEAAEYIDRRAPVDRIVNYTERDTDKTVAIGTVLGLATPGAETYHLIANKIAMRERLAAAGVDRTAASLVRTPTQVRRFAEHAGYPLICKPAGGVGSRGVRRISGPDDIPAALEWARAAVPALDCPAVMVEQFHTGAEYSVEALSENGEHVIACITRKFLGPAHFVEVGHVLPAELDAATTRSVEHTVRAALDALGIRDGVTHTEVICTGDRVHIVETHLRPAGDQIPYLLAHVRSIDLLDALARQSVGLAALPAIARAVAAPVEQFAAIWYACPDPVGEVLSVDGVPAARALPGVQGVEVLIGPGQQLPGLANSGGRAAYAWATAPTAAEACQRARSAVQALRFSVRSTPGRYASAHDIRPTGRVT
jgi:biotin carboxylase